MALNLKREQTPKAWLLRALIGPAQIIDGLCSLVTVGTYAPGLGLATARALAMARFAATRQVVYPVPVVRR